jgi:replicative superfamily II helicase
MQIDFEKLVSGDSMDALIEPRKIFSTLPNKAAKYSYLRDVQSEVLDAWFTRRIESDLVLKMNTGAGKTVVGLLILQSCLNEKKGPVVYVAPDHFLCGQVCFSAGELGIRS